MTTFRKDGEKKFGKRSKTMNRPDVIEEIAEKVHNIQDLLRERPDDIVDYYCEQIIERLNVLAKVNMEDYS